jgi:hypothetical protein
MRIAEVKKGSEIKYAVELDRKDQEKLINHFIKEAFGRIKPINDATGEDYENACTAITSGKTYSIHDIKENAVYMYDNEPELAAGVLKKNFKKLLKSKENIVLDDFLANHIGVTALLRYRGRDED